MRIGWLITTQIAVLLGGAATAEAQLGRALDAPRREAPRPTASPAEAPPAADGWAFDVAAQTSLPLSVGLEGTLRTPIGLTFQLGLGHTPNAYLDAMASALSGAGVIPARMEPVVDDALANGGWNVRASVGFTAFDGLELAVGYTALFASAGLRSSSIDAALNQAIPWPAGTEQVPMSLTLHALHARVGWRFEIEEHFLLRIAVGWTHTVAVEAHLDVPPEMRMPPDDPATRMERAVSEGLGEYGFTPELILGAGYRF